MAPAHVPPSSRSLNTTRAASALRSRAATFGWPFSFHALRELLRRNREVGTGLQQVTIRGHESNVESSRRDDELRIVRRHVSLRCGFQDVISRWLNLTL